MLYRPLLLATSDYRQPCFDKGFKIRNVKRQINLVYVLVLCRRLVVVHSRFQSLDGCALKAA